MSVSHFAFHLPLSWRYKQSVLTSLLNTHWLYLSHHHPLRTCQVCHPILVRTFPLTSGPSLVYAMNLSGPFIPSFMNRPMMFILIPSGRLPSSRVPSDSIRPLRVKLTKGLPDLFSRPENTQKYNWPRRSSTMSSVPSTSLFVNDSSAFNLESFLNVCAGAPATS